MKKLDEFQVFENLTPHFFDELEKLMVKKSYTTQQIILDDNDRSNDVYFLLAGKVQAKRFAEDGHEIVFVDLKEGDVFGEFSAIDNLERSAQIMSLSDVVMGKISAKNFKMLILKEPQLGFNLALHLVHKLRSLSERVYDYSAYPVATRIRKMLLRLTKEASVINNHFHIKPAPTHYDIAVMTSTHREAVSREFAILMKLGILKTGRQAITITDLPRLKQLVLQE